MRAALLTALAAIISLVSAQQAAATTITFEELDYTYYNYYPSPDRMGFYYYQYGVAVGPYRGNGYAYGAITPNGTWGIYAASPYGRGGSPQPIGASFPQPTDYVSVDLGDFGVDAEDIYLDAYGKDGTLLGESRLSIADTDMSMHTLALALPGITFAVFGSTDPHFSGGGIFADNLTFNDGSVPEPASWAMMIAGFGAIGATMRRRKVSARFA